jgi:ornithine cyclodeaminase/alanine dehydrogenase-like protein (mu-crystallin family)
MTPLIITASEVERVAEIGTLAERLGLEYSRGLAGTDVPARVSVLKDSPFKAFDTMPAVNEQLGLFIVKVGAVVPQPPPAKSVHAMITVFCTNTGRPLALVDGESITNVKCAAVSALVTDRCVPSGSQTVAVIGAGVQAWAQIRAISAVRPLDQVRVYSRTKERLHHFISEVRKALPDTIVVACATAHQACEGAKIVATATTSTTPVVEADYMEGDDWHINCTGNHLPESREISNTLLLGGALVVVEDKETAIAEAGETHRAAISLEALMKLDTARLRSCKTIFASTGHAFLDLVTIHYVLCKLGLR